MLRRRSSVPSQPNGILRSTNSQLPTPRPTVHFQLDNDETHKARIDRQANALAKMAMELNFAKIHRRLDMLEEDVKALSTANTEIQCQSETQQARLTEMHNDLSTFREPAHKECAKHHEELGIAIRQLRSELELTKNLLRQPSLTLTESQLRTPSILPHHHSLDHRIKETLNSTRRWNRDHKVTSILEGTFVANYLKQQSKRDAPIAVFIQKMLKARVRRRLTNTDSRPQTIEAFRREVTWNDVRAVIETEFVADTRRITHALQERHS